MHNDIELACLSCNIHWTTDIMDDPWLGTGQHHIKINTIAYYYVCIIHHVDSCYQLIWFIMRSLGSRVGGGHIYWLNKLTILKSKPPRRSCCDLD